MHRSTAKNVTFDFKGPLNLINSSKSPFLKFDPKTMLSLLCMGTTLKHTHISCLAVCYEAVGGCCRSKNDVECNE